MRQIIYLLILAIGEVNRLFGDVCFPSTYCVSPKSEVFRSYHGFLSYCFFSFAIPMSSSFSQEAQSLVSARQNNPRAMFEQKPKSIFDEEEKRPMPAARAPPPPRYVDKVLLYHMNVSKYFSVSMKNQKAVCRM